MSNCLWSIFESTGLVVDYLAYINQGKHSMNAGSDGKSCESGDFNDWTDNSDGNGA